MMIKISKEELYKLYWKKEYTLTEIGKMFNCAGVTIFFKLKKFGIKTRNRIEANNTKRFKKRNKGRNAGKDNPQWKGGITKSWNGYIYIKNPDHPGATKRGYVKRSRLVAEKMLGRYLYPEEIVHHENEIKDDDRPENIEVKESRSSHMKHHRNLQISRR